MPEKFCPNTEQRSLHLLPQKLATHLLICRVVWPGVRCTKAYVVLNIRPQANETEHMAMKIASTLRCAGMYVCVCA